MADEAVTPPKVAQLTRAELARLRDRARREREKFNDELLRLAHGEGRIAERKVDLRNAIQECDFFVSRILGAIEAAQEHPRGWRGFVPDPDGYPRYNPHRRLAIMERSYL